MMFIIQPQFEIMTVKSLNMKVLKFLYPLTELNWQKDQLIGQNHLIINIKIGPVRE